MSDNAPVPQAPDYGPLIESLKGLANYAQNNAAESMAWAKEQIAKNTDLTGKVNEKLLEDSDFLRNIAKTAYAQGQEALTRGNKELLDQVDRYSDPERIKANMGAAQANVAQNFEAARENATRNLEGFGIDPSSTRYAALDRGIRAQQAAAQAAAGTMSARQDDALRSQAIDKLVQQGNVLQGNVAPAIGGAGSVGTGAINNSLANTASGYNGIGTGQGWTGTAMSGLTGAANTMNTSYNNQLAQNKAENSNSSGIGSLLGAGASLIPILTKLEDGGVVPPEVTSGGAVPAEASPSGGAQTDDVNAKVNAGEFVVPKDVAQWKGEEFFQKLIMQARKAKQVAPAKPAIGPATNGVGGPPPTEASFQSRPAIGATT